MSSQSGVIEYSFPNVRAQRNCTLSGQRKQIGLPLADNMMTRYGEDDIQRQLQAAERSIEEMDNLEISVTEVKDRVDNCDSANLIKEAGLGGATSLEQLRHPHLYTSEPTQSPYRNALRLLGFIVPIEEPGNASVTVCGNVSSPLACG